MNLSTLNKFGCYHSAHKNMQIKGRYDSLKKGIRKKREKKEDYGRCFSFFFFISDLRPSRNKYAAWIARHNKQEI